MDTGHNHYPHFEYPATQLSAFSYSLGTFIISLKDGIIVQFRPENIEDFKSWLIRHKVRDINIDRTTSGRAPT